jgi:uncharacterized protein
VLAYLDASAIVKLVLAEAETAPLYGFLREAPDRISSVVAAVEVPRAVRRAGATARSMDRVDRVLARIDLLELDDPIRTRAAALDPVGLRTLDAIHVASALEIGSDVACLVTYDERQARAARSEGLVVFSPGVPDISER